LALGWGLPKPIIKSHTKEKVDVALCYRSSQILRVSFNIYATAEASNFKFGKQLWLAKAHHKNHQQRKSGGSLGLGKLSNIWVSPLIFCNGCAVLLALAELLVISQDSLPTKDLHLPQR